MIRFFKIFLSSILIASFTIGTKETVDKLSINELTNLPFHPDIKISNNASNTNRQEIGHGETPDKDIYTGTTQIKWTDYAYSWDEFKSYYKTIALSASGYADAKSADKKSFTNLKITVSDLEKRSTWRDNSTLKASGSKWCLAYTAHSFTWGSWNQSGVYYDAYVNDSYIKIRFYLWTKANQAGWGSMWTESHVQYSGGTISSLWNINNIKESLNTALANRITLNSDYSGSVEDANNIIDPTGKGNDETTLLNSVIAKILGKEYNDWKKYIQPFSFSDARSEATIVFKFPDPVTSQQQVWIFKTPISITLSSDYWIKSLKNRLQVTLGKIVNPKDSTKGWVDDEGIQLEPDKITETYGGTIQLHTTARLLFTGLEDSSEWLTVNGQPVEVLDNKFYYEMIDNRINDENKINQYAENTSNSYDIVLHHDDAVNKEEYQIKYVINSLVPKLEQKWYAWDPNNNSDQKKLITPTLPNGKPNPNYDKEINPSTGTKTQILWVKKKSQYPFPLDPLNKNGEQINPEENPKEYDLGFIAEGSVVGKGVQQLFDTDQVKNVSREGVDNSLNEISNPNDKQKLTEISSDTTNKYWSWQGMWHYITKTNEGLAYEKYVLIGAKYENQYPRFLDVLENLNIAVDFWTTIHGIHLKNYLVAEKYLESKDIIKLTFEQVSSYWKEYTSDVISQRVSPTEPANQIDLSKITLNEIKINESSIVTIKQRIIEKVKVILNNKGITTLDYNIDYEFKPFDNQSIEKLLDLNSSGYAEMEFTINSVNTSTKAIGFTTFTVINNIHYNPDNSFDLSTINPWTITKNFSNLTIQQLKDNWILRLIADKLISARANLSYPTDYNVNPLDDQTLQTFLENKKVANLTITIKAEKYSGNAENSTTLELINDPDAEIAPPEPPDPKPDPDPNPDPNPNPDDNNSWISKKENLIILSIIITIVITTFGTTVFLKYRFKKGIRGKKNISKK